MQADVAPHELIDAGEKENRELQENHDRQLDEGQLQILRRDSEIESQAVRQDECRNQNREVENDLYFSAQVPRPERGIS